MYHRRGSGGVAGGFGGLGIAAPSRWAIFCNFLEKKAFLMPLNHNSQVFEAM